jgi:hypothetical protein
MLDRYGASAADQRAHADQAERDDAEKKTRADGETEKPPTLIGAIQSRRTAEQIMWDHYQHRITAGLLPPTGAELDEVARTNNYGRAVLRKWRRKGRTVPPSMSVVR